MFLVDGIQCYQCSSEEDEFCPAFGKFDETKNALVDCFSLESFVPGHMCMKMVKESYDTFYGMPRTIQIAGDGQNIWYLLSSLFSKGIQNCDTFMCFPIDVGCRSRMSIFRWWSRTRSRCLRKFFFSVPSNSVTMDFSHSLSSKPRSSSDLFSFSIVRTAMVVMEVLSMPIPCCYYYWHCSVLFSFRPTDVDPIDADRSFVMYLLVSSFLHYPSLPMYLITWFFFVHSFFSSPLFTEEYRISQIKTILEW